MRSVVFLAMVLGELGMSYGQVNFEGKVIDGSTREPLVGATLRLADGRGGVTDENGEFSLSVGLDESVTISFLGYQSKVVTANTTYQLIEMESDYVLEDLIILGVRASSSDAVAEKTVSKKTIGDQYNGEHPYFYLERLTPSIFSFSESGTKVANGGNFRLRGIEQQRINISLNGVPLNDQIDHGVFFNNFTDISGNFESVQVQRGVGTSTNGVASYAGSINFESVNLRDQTAGGEVQLGAGSYNTFRMNGSARSGLLENNTAFYGSFSRLYSDGYRDNTFTDAYSFFFSGGYFGEKDLIRITAFDANAKNGLGYSPVLGTVLEQDPRTNVLNENDEDDFGQQLVQLQHTHLFNAGLKVTSSLYYGYAGGDFLFTFDNGNGGLDQINFPLENRHYGLLSNLFWDLSSQWSVSTGIHTFLFDRKNMESTGPDFANPYYEESSDKNEFSWFGKATWQVDQWQISGDVQVRNTSLSITPDFDFLGTIPGADIEDNRTFVNPKIGVSYFPTASLTLYGSFGRVGREPTRIDVIGGFTIDSLSYATALDEQFEAEFVNDFELGARYSRARISVNANFFYLDFENEIAPVGEILNFGLSRRANIRNSFRTGVELDWSVIPVSWLDVSGNITYMHAEIQSFEDEDSGLSFDGNTPVLSPDWIYNLNIGFKPARPFTIGLSANGIGESFLELSNDSNLVLPAYTIYDAFVRFDWKFLSVSAELNNLTDKLYFSSGAPVDVDFDGVVEGPGYLVGANRNFFITTKFRF